MNRLNRTELIKHTILIISMTYLLQSLSLLALLRYSNATASWDSRVGYGLLVLFMGLMVASILLYIQSIISRLHDLNHSSWHILWLFIPVANIIFIVWIFIGSGSHGANRFGYLSRKRMSTFGLMLIIALTAACCFKVGKLLAKPKNRIAIEMLMASGPKL